MTISTVTQSASAVTAEAVVVGCFQGQPLAGGAAVVDEAGGGALRQLVESGEITGKLGEVTTLLTPAGIAAGRLVVVGLGRAGEFDQGAAFRASAAAAKRLAAKRRASVAFFHLPDDAAADMVAAAVAGVAAGCRGQDLYRAHANLHPFEEQRWSDRYQAAAVEEGRILGDAVNLTRNLVNEPPSNMDPGAFTAAAREAAERAGLEFEAWDRDRLEAERCGALLAVARGSARPPSLVMLRHQGGPPDQPPWALVGKGVTFDSGGLSLKPSEGMKTMKCDMAGAATVLGAMQAIGQLQLPVNVIGLVGLVENMVSGDSYKLGDVLTARSGKTIEVLNTDAEGRLVLADVLDVAVERGAVRIVDLATLTGACVVALGLDVAGLMSNDDAWCRQVADAAKVCGEPAWPLPMFAEYGEQIKSQVADIKNVGEGRWGGAITAAKFLEEFVKETPWVHIDIAGPSFLEREKPWLDAGGSGAFVRTLVQLARGWS